MNPDNHTFPFAPNDPAFREVLERQRTEQQPGTATLDSGQADGHEVLLLIGGLIERLVVASGIEYQLGRFEAPDAYQVDLDAYGAVERGISRIHASLFMRDEHLYIVDQGSTNGTYVGGQRLEADQPVLLHKGSEVLLGRLRMQIMFR